VALTRRIGGVAAVLILCLLFVASPYFQGLFFPVPKLAAISLILFLGALYAGASLVWDRVGAERPDDPVGSQEHVPLFGWHPVSVDEGSMAGTQAIPADRKLRMAGQLVKEEGIGRVILALPHFEGADIEVLSRRYLDGVPDLVLLPKQFNIASLWVEGCDLEGILGLHVRDRLLVPSVQMLKRLLDVSLTVVVGICALPFLGAIALAIKLESSGPVFYIHRRLGDNGQTIPVVKFRTMVQNADEVLEDTLNNDPSARQEWLETQKLKNDPRITRVGAVLRRLSLDELPQLWNVLRGEMSLVGPRPIVEEEVPKYGLQYELYKRVKPGITGLWQVSGRNDTTYAERVELDAYYVRNWSICLDLVILARTAKVVLLGKGAY